MTFIAPIIIHDTADPYAGQYDEEFTLSLSDWYHTDVPTLIDQMLQTSNPRAVPPFPNSMLMNDGGPAQFNFQPGKTYKVRIVSMAAFASFMLQFDSHTMSIIEIDGSYVKKQDAYQIRISAAQRFTVLLKAQTSIRRNYGFLASLDQNRDFTAGGAAWPINMTGVIQYDAAKGPPPAFVVPKWSPKDDAVLVALDNQALLGPRPGVDKTITLDFQFGLDAGGIPR